MNDTASESLPPETLATELSSAPQAPPEPPQPLIVRAADDIASAAGERAVYYGVGHVSITIGHDGTFQIRSSTLDLNILVGVLARISTHLMTSFPQPLAPGKLSRG